MKMPALPLAAALALAACSQTPDPESSGHTGTNEHADEVVFSPGKGLALGETAKANMGLESLDVSPRPAATTLAYPAHVFREAGERTVEGRYQRDFAYASCLIPQEAARSLQPGQEITAKANGQILPGARIHRLDGQMSGFTGQVEALVALPDPGQNFPIGTSLEISWKGAEVREALQIPSEAVLKTAKGDFVFVANEGFYLRTPVRISAGSEGWVLVEDGLFEGDTVVSKGVQGLYLAELQAVNGGTGCTHGH